MKDYRYFSNEEPGDIDENYRPSNSEIYQRRSDRKKKRTQRIAGTAAAILAAAGIMGGAVFAGSMNTKLKANDGMQTVQTAAEKTTDATDAQAEEMLNNSGLSELTENDASDASASPLSFGKGTADNNGQEMTTEEIAQKDMASMVAITNTSEVNIQDMYGSFFNNMTPTQQEQTTMGTGVIVSEDKDYLYMVTNQHVINGAKKLTVSFIDESTADAEVVGEDASHDLAVVKVALKDLDKSTKEAISVIKVGNFDDVKVGQKVVAIGNALGYGQSVSEGIVSALDRTIGSEDGSSMEGLVQTDAAINPGNSGGALLNSSGELIAINSAKYASTEIEGMGFAIPVKTAVPIIEDMISGKYAEDSENSSVSPSENGAYLGVSCLGIDKDKASYYNIPEGIYLKEVVQDGAAANAGLQQGDVITEAEGKAISTVDELTAFLNEHKSGDVVTMTVARAGVGGQYFSGEVQVTLGSRSGQ